MRGSKSRCKQRLPYQNFLIVCFTTSLPCQEKAKSKKAKEKKCNFYLLPFTFLDSFLFAGCYVTHLLEQTPLNLLFQVSINPSKHIPEQSPRAMPEMTKEE